jgi:hypothetical protein
LGTVRGQRQGGDQDSNYGLNNAGVFHLDSLSVT